MQPVTVSTVSDACARGASGSAGRTSWTGKPELGDYVSVYGFALSYINAIYQQQDASSTMPRCSDAVLILGGYSYGSMIASHLLREIKFLNCFEPRPWIRPRTKSTVEPKNCLETQGHTWRCICQIRHNRSAGFEATKRMMVGSHIGP